MMNYLRFIIAIGLTLLLTLFFPNSVQADSIAPTPITSTCQFYRTVPLNRPQVEGKPTDVMITLYLLDLISINELKDSFKADLFVKLQWQDERLGKQLRLNLIPSCRVKMDEIWHPQVQILNQLQLNEILEQVMWVDESGTVTYYQRINGEMLSKLDLRRFPFDTQTLNLQLWSFANNSEKVNFVKDESLKGYYRDPSIVGWLIDSVQIGIRSSNFPGVDESFDLFNFKIIVKRDSGFYIWKELLPFTMLIGAAYLVFWLEPTIIIPQVSILTGVLISLVAYQLSLPQRFPRYSYLTKSDDLILGNLVLVLIALVETVVTYNLIRGGRKDLALAIDYWLRGLFPILLTGLILFYLVL